MMLQALTCHPQGMVQLLEGVSQILTIVQTLTPSDSYTLRQQLAAISLAIQAGTSQLRTATAQLRAELG